MRFPVRVAVCPDFREEQWPSMDRVADELLRVLASKTQATVVADCVRPPFRQRAGRLLGGRIGKYVDRGMNRLLDYPAHVGQRADAFDVFHVVDHSYAQLVHRLPAHRTIVTCHDLDTFRSVLHSEEEPRSFLFQSMTRHIMRGLSQAAIVTCDSDAVRRQLIEARIVDADRIVVVPIGVDAVFCADADSHSDRALPSLGLSEARHPAVELLHVGSVAPRKRIEFLLEIVASLKASLPGVRLIRVGGAFTAHQQRTVESLGISDSVIVIPSVSDRILAALYRRATVTMLPSDREGFGLPVAEALACGSVVVASDLPVLREVGGPAVEYCPVGTAADVHTWVGTVLKLLDERAGAPARWQERRNMGRSWAARYSWTRFAERMIDLYVEVAKGGLRDTSGARRVA